MNFTKVPSEEILKIKPFHPEKLKGWEDKKYIRNNVKHNNNWTGKYLSEENLIYCAIDKMGKVYLWVLPK